MVFPFTQSIDALMKALVVEDTVTSATLICQKLRKMGIEPVHAIDGEKGLEIFERERPDVVLLDIILPGIDGFEVAQRLRQRETDGEWTPIIFLTARPSEADLQRGIQVGGDDYLVKPISDVVLEAKVRAMQRIAQMRHALISVTHKLDEANRELTRLSTIDGLTGIANRRHFDEVLAQEWRRAMRNRHPLSLVVIDVDCFKQFNDGYGHQVGDECLKAVAQILADKLRRPSDLAARYGGEEFVGVLPETTEEGAVALAEEVRMTLQNKRISHRFSLVAPHVTISAGVATTIPERGDENGFTALLHAADQALYEAKRSGRNRVMLMELSAPTMF